MMWLRLAYRSAASRKFTLSMVVLAIAMSVALLLGVERLRVDARSSFNNAISGTDLVVGARGSPLQLLLYSVFRLGGVTNNMSWDSYQTLAARPEVTWAVPISLGDSYKGLPVLAVGEGYFEHFRYGDKQPLVLHSGRVMAADHNGVFEVVIGWQVAQRLGLQVNDSLALTHGMAHSGNSHSDKPFTVVGVLAPTATPVDRTLHITLAGMEALHLGWMGGRPLKGVSISADQVRKFDLTPSSVTAVLVGLERRIQVFGLQRFVSEYQAEPLMAVLPGVALSQLWQLLSIMEKTLLAVSILVLLVSSVFLVAVMLAGLNERRRELAVLRALGASSLGLFGFLLLEGVLLALAGVALGISLLGGLQYLASNWALTEYGIALGAGFIRVHEWPLLAGVIGLAGLAAMVPGLRAYQLSLADGLSARV